MCVATKSRAEYFRKRRETLKMFAVMIERDTLDELDAKIAAQGKTRSDWLREKISEELSK
ncbi:hypothetical protein H8S45_10365 [Agathobaculum sp. NSJ-28]|uniref:Ribbon-helix-helix protein, CopG family n=1 Tax=Agathobaculum faecis TaxID=2763013 RepID=A0A923LXQ0_9FIRM|nr:ribbon-helix-helix protein, CopG family [Agathobaculum faecis]MBC5725857.1 hypothetical protein [Agathobaculum faecis]